MPRPPRSLAPPETPPRVPARARAACFAAASVALAGAASAWGGGCASASGGAAPAPASASPRPGGSADGAEPFGAGAFFSIEVRGDREGAGELRALARPLVAGLADALALALPDAALAARVAEDLRAFELDREPAELAVGVAWIDREGGAEGIEVELRRTSHAGRSAALALTLLDRPAAPAAAGAAGAPRPDGAPDFARFALRPARSPPLELRLEPAPEGARVLLRVDGGAERVVVDAAIEPLLARLGALLYAPLSGEGYARRVRGSTRPARARAAAPPGTSFRAPEARP